jgi:hypothetical protein
MATSQYSRINFQTIITPKDGSLPWISFLDSNYARISKHLTTAKSRIVAVNEVANLPLISYHEYGTVDLWWVLAAYNGIVNPFLELPAGKTINIPNISSIEEYLRKAADKFPSTVQLP